MRVKPYFLLSIALAAGPAVAINKCKGPDGRVTYQEAACPSTAQESQSVKTWVNSFSGSESLGSWKFERKHDDMTGKVACLAMSAITFPQTPQPKKFMPVHMVAAITTESEVIGLRTSDNSNSFHTDIQGMGVKTNNGQFMPFTMKSGSHVVGFGNDTSLFEMLANSTQLLVRARFWPYEQLYDMVPIPSAGFEAALRQARACAGR